MMILRLKPNLLGRDFVCGDIHGSYSLVEKMLSDLAFDKSKDRLICDGDLIDRGPENEKCLALLNEPWFFSTKGNHEQMMIDHHRYNGASWWLSNGGKWGIDLDNSDDRSITTKIKEELIPYISIMENMPELITVEKKDGTIFHVIHAELFSLDPLTDDDLADENRLSDVAHANSMDGPFIIWGRSLFYTLYSKHMDERAVRKYKTQVKLEKLDSLFSDKLSHIYCGHTIVRQPTTAFSQTNLDTCAYGNYDYDKYVAAYPLTVTGNGFGHWCGLTVTEPETGRFWTIKSSSFEEVNPLIISHTQEDTYVTQ